MYETATEVICPFCRLDDVKTVKVDPNGQAKTYVRCPFCRGRFAVYTELDPYTQEVKVTT